MISEFDSHHLLALCQIWTMLTCWGALSALVASKLVKSIIISEFDSHSVSIRLYAIRTNNHYWIEIIAYNIIISMRWGYLKSYNCVKIIIKLSLINKVKLKLSLMNYWKENES